MARKFMIPYREFLERIDLMAKMGVKYEYRACGNSVVFKMGGVTYYCTTIGEKNKKDRLPPKQLYFISKVKRHIEKNKLHKKIRKNYSDREDIRYFEYNKKVEEGEYFSDTYSVDIVKAYWVSALKDGWITKEIYEEGLDKDKRIRLASLGSFAKETYVYKYDGSRENVVDNIKSKNPHVFFNQANSIFKVMRKCKVAIKDNFLFYWTDGLYVCSEKSAKECECIIKKLGFQVKITKLISIHRTNSSFVSTEINEETGKPTEKVYKIPMRNEKKKNKKTTSKNSRKKRQPKISSGKNKKRAINNKRTA